MTDKERSTCPCCGNEVDPNRPMDLKPDHIKRREEMERLKEESPLIRDLHKKTPVSDRTIRTWY